MKFNANFDSLWTKSYEPTWDSIWYNDLMSSSYTCGVDKDGNYITVGNSRIADNGDTIAHAGNLLLIKTDTAGNVIWRHTYPPDASATVGYSIDFDPENNYWVSGKLNYPNSMSHFWKISPDGQLLWHTTYDYNLSSYQIEARNVLCLPDSSVVVSGAKCRDNNYLTSYSVNYKNNQKNWDLYYYPGMFNHASASPVMAVLSHDSNFVQVGLGAIWDPYYCNSFADTALFYWLLTKVSYDGKILWYRKIRPEYPEQVDSFNIPNPYDLILTRDNGFAMTGWGLDTAAEPDYITWLVKTDSLGCDGMYSCIDTAMVLNLLNPVDTVCADDTTWLNFELNGLSAPFSLYFSTGDTINNLYYNKQYIAVSGPYTDTSQAMSWRIYQQYPFVANASPNTIIELTVTLEGHYGSRLTRTFSFYVKDCHVDNPLQELKNAMAIYPNPSTGNFTVSIPENLQGTYLTIANATGQIIRVIPLDKGKTVYHHTGKLPPGTYFIGIDNGKKTIVKRLVVK